MAKPSTPRSPCAIARRDGEVHLLRAAHPGGKIDGEATRAAPIRDGEITPACQQACPAEAIVFGDLNDPESRVRRQHDEKTAAYGMLAELNVKPRTKYLAGSATPTRSPAASAWTRRSTIASK
jgi:hypothetical protein